MALDLLLAALALIGHGAMFLACFNRLHAVGWHRRPRRLMELALVLFTVAVFGWYSARWLTGTSPFAAWHSGKWWEPSYPNLCLVAAAALVPCWLWPKLLSRQATQLISTQSRTIDVRVEAGAIPLHGQATFCAYLPGNQFLKLEVATKTLQLERLPAGLNGLTITHLSDLHFTGDIGQKYFDYVINRANELQSDVIIISGDIIESTACLPWIQQTLGRLAAPLGKYYVLGNHDKRMRNVAEVRQRLNDTGLIDLGGRCLMANWRDCQVLLAGNELPWFPTVGDQDLESLSQSLDSDAFRLLISHSPDQFAWARKRGFDLMLAGHNHGGQMRLPLVGALVSPSLYGTRYSGGAYYQAPTLLHVSRGISGEHPIRWNCLPELAQLVLRAG